MAYLSAGGTITYNGYSFLGPRNSVDVIVTPVRDSTNRFTTHSIRRFTVSAWITSDVAGESSGGSDTKSHMNSIRAALEKDGGALTITGFGYGDVTVNTTNSNLDAEWGPKTESLDLRNIADKCIVVVWKVAVAIKICNNGDQVGNLGRLKEYAYSVNWSILNNGCTVRTVQGHLEIYNNQLIADRGTALSKTADDYRDSVKVEPIVGFMRNQPQQYRLSENGSRLDFSVTDTEKLSNNAYPPGVADIEFDHTVTTSLLSQAGGFTGQEGSFTGMVQMAKPHEVSAGWEKALLLMQERLIHAINNGASPMLMSISITESVFQRRISFQVVYRLLETGGISKLVQTSGLFRDFNSVTDAAYDQSMLISHSQRGNAGLIHDASSNILIDACASSDPVILIRDNKTQRSLGEVTSKIFLQCPPKEKSYLNWMNFIKFSQDATVINVETMPQSNVSQSSTALAAFDVLNGLQVNGNSTATRRQSVQTSGDSQPRVEITIRGGANRIGFPVEIPSVLSVMGQNASFISSKSSFEQTVKGYYSVGSQNCPIYSATWVQVYQCQFPSLSMLNQAITLGFAALTFSTPDSQNPNEKVNGM